jgi:hypothetical protein
MSVSPRAPNPCFEGTAGFAAGRPLKLHVRQLHTVKLCLL